MDGAQQQCTTCANILGSTAQRLRQLEEECQQLRASQLEYSKRLQFLEDGLRSLDDDDLPHEMGSTTHYLTPPGLLTFRRPSGMLGRGPQNDLPAVAGADLARLSRSISDQCWHGVMRDSSGERSSVMFPICDEKWPNYGNDGSIARNADYCLSPAFYAGSELLQRPYLDDFYRGNREQDNDQQGSAAELLNSDRYEAAFPNFVESDVHELERDDQRLVLVDPFGPVEAVHFEQVTADDMLLSAEPSGMLMPAAGSLATLSSLDLLADDGESTSESSRDDVERLASRTYGATTTDEAEVANDEQCHGSPPWLTMDLVDGRPDLSTGFNTSSPKWRLVLQRAKATVGAT